MISFIQYYCISKIFKNIKSLGINLLKTKYYEEHLIDKISMPFLKTLKLGQFDDASLLKGKSNNKVNIILS
jgi:hypothetical protein